MKVRCIDDSNRPGDFPLSLWIKKGDDYTIVKREMINQSNTMGVQLEERPNMPMPYMYFRESRFAPLDDLPTDEFQDALDDALSEVFEDEKILVN